MAQYYKVLGANRMPCHGGSGQWAEPGTWMPEITDITPCERGYHLVTRDRLVCWLGPEIWEADGRGERIDADDKTVFSEARLIRRLDAWNYKTARLFACDCAERVLPIFSAAHPGDGRLQNAIDVARRYAGGQATPEELAAACDAASAAARDAASDAASAAAWAAAWADAARAAAARAAAWAAAARAAAWAAAARDAARDAASAAARAAERTWQTERLFDYLEGRL